MFDRKNYDKKWKKNHPWCRHYWSAKQRCEGKTSTSYNWYGGRGIRVEFSIEDVKELWFRDKAFLLKSPSLDRINSDGNYTKENCRFIENKENLLMGSKKSSRPVMQKTLQGEVVNFFESIKEAWRKTGIQAIHISSCALGRPKRLTAGGFKWSFYNKTLTGNRSKRLVEMV